MGIVSLPKIQNYNLPMVFVGSYAISYFAFKALRHALSATATVNQHQQLPLPPSLRSWPVFGSLPFLPEFYEWHIYFLQISQQIGSVFSIYLGSRHTVVLNGSKAIREALVKHSIDFADRTNFYLDKNVLNINSKGIIDHHYNTEFRHQHQLALSILKEFGFGKDIMEERIHTEVSALVQRIHDLGGHPFWPDSAITSGVLNVVVSIAFGQRMGDELLSRLITIIHGMMHDTVDVTPIDLFPMMRFVPNIRREMHRLRDYNQQLFEIIGNSITSASEDSFVRRYVDQEADQCDDEQLQYIVRDLLIAGTETSASTLLWAIGMLARSNDDSSVQVRLRAEIDTVVPRDRLPSLADRPHLPFVEATILEVMRRRTVVPLALPHQTSCDTVVAGFRIPAGTTIMPNLYSAHMDPTVWENPAEFQPERFLDDHGKIVGKERVIPFSLGRRSCLGELLAQQEIYLFLTGIIQNFIIKPPEGCTMVELHEKVSVTVAPKMYEVCLIPRA